MTNDNHLAYLLSLGFELELCKQALKQNLTLEDATEWILDPNRPSVLKLDLDLSKPLASSSNLSRPAIATSKLEEKRKESQQMKEYQKQQVNRIAEEMKKERMLEREARRRALLDIKEDKEKRKRNARSQTDAPPTNSATATTVATDGPGKIISIEPSTEDMAFIQFKLTDSTALRQRFPAKTTIHELLKFVLEKESNVNGNTSLENISLINAFPRRTFTVQDGSLNMYDVHFLPNVSLIVKVEAPTVIEEAETHEEQDDTMNERSMSEEMTNEEDEDEEVEEANNLAEDYDGMDLDFTATMDPHRPPRTQQAWGRIGAGHHLSDPSPAVDTSIVTEAPTDGAEENNSIRRTNILSALEERRSSSTNTDIQQLNAPHHHGGVGHHTKTLREICSVAVGALLPQHTQIANRYLKNVANMSPEVAESLLKYLTQTGKLNAFTLRKLADHCYLQNVALDAYVYCTDSLIDDLTKSKSTISIAKLSLGGCELLTDNAIRSLTNLKYLNELDMSNCKVTDKGLMSLKSLTNLCHLNLSKTKITDRGIASIVSNAKFKDQLQVLLLDGCSRVTSSGTLISLVNGFTRLIQLSLADTCIQPQEKTEALRKDIKLEQLNMKNTMLNDDNLIQIVSEFRRLVELELGGCVNITTRGLSFLPRELRNLRYIQFPNREHELDGVLSRYKNLPLEHLDLKGFLNLTDEGAQHIACMRHLRYLSLEGTKVTDEAIILLKDLIELEELNLDRTLLTDAGLGKLIGLSKLGTLSLCHTEVSNFGLILLGDFEQTTFTRYLRTLNLAHCTLVTNKGVRGLAGMANLTNLNLDQTSVSKSCLKYLKDLPKLKPVRLQGIKQEEIEEDIDSE